jgi:biotin carboxyl carrier protein
MPEPEEFEILRIDDAEYLTQLTEKVRNHKVYVAANPKHITCVIPGVIRKLYVHPGKKVSCNGSLLILEAMKMQNDVRSPVDGIVKAVHVQVGKMVAKGELLLELE